MADLEVQLEKWKNLLLAFSGASAVLLATALAELPLLNEAYQRMGRIMTVSPWFGICFVLLLACLAPGVSLLVGKSWRILPLARRLPVALGFLGCAWALLAAFDLRIIPLDPPFSLHAVVLVAGAALAGACLVWGRRRNSKEELFP